MTSQTFATADDHFWHPNIIKYCKRPFDSVEEMNETLVENWNERVAAEDEVFILGDLALGTPIVRSLQIVRRLNGHKYLVPGNHDRCFSGRKKRTRADTEMYEDVGLQVVGEQIPIVLGGKHMAMMSHFPYEGDSHDVDRYMNHRPVDRGQWLLCGHVHTAWAERGRQINVGVDVRNFAPMHTDEILAIIDRQG